jgi:hypothetical protein
MATRKRVNGVPEVSVIGATGGRDIAITIHVDAERYHQAKDRSHGGVLTRRRPSPPPGFKARIAKDLLAHIDEVMPYPALTPEQAKQFESEERYEL